MKEETEKLFRALKSEVIDLHLRWMIYRQLFAGSEADVEILNRSGSNVFYLLQFWILDDVTLRLAKITDPPVQGKFENLSLERLSASLEGDSRDFVERELRPVLDRLGGACEKFRQLRNKRVAHRDLSHAIGLAEPPLPGISREDVETALLLVREAMNKTELHHSRSQTAYEQMIVPYDSDGNRLIKVLKLGLAAEEKERATR